MRIVVLGAAGGTGREVVRQAVADGHEVVAFVRSAEQIEVGTAAQVVVGDATSAEDLKAAFVEADAVISTLGAAQGTLITDSTRAVVVAAEATGTRRVTVLSSFAVRRDRLAGPLRLVTSLAMRGIVRDKTAGEARLRDSDLDWTIVYATRLTNGPSTSTAHVLDDQATVGLKDKVSRADVARWLLSATTSPDYRRRSITVTG